MCSSCSSTRPNLELPSATSICSWTVPLPVIVELGRTTMLVRDIMALGPGSVIELEKAAGENVDILVNGRLIARGEVVVIEENFGVRIVEFVGNPEKAV